MVAMRPVLEFLPFILKMSVKQFYLLEDLPSRIEREQSPRSTMKNTPPPEKTRTPQQRHSLKAKGELAGGFE